jgi:hypothetical protein
MRANSAGGAEPITVTATVPASGVGGRGSRQRGATPIWANATGDPSVIDATNGLELLLAHTSTAGRQYPSLTGGYSFSTEAVMATYGP